MINNIVIEATYVISNDTNCLDGDGNEDQKQVGVSFLRRTCLVSGTY